MYKINKYREDNNELQDIVYFFTHSVDVFCTTGTDGYFKNVNQAFEKALGYSKEELLSKSLLDFIHPEDQAKTIEIRQKIFSKYESVYNFQNRFCCKDGSYIWLEWDSVYIPEKGLVYAIGRNVTERKKVEEALRLSEEILYKAFNANPNIVTISTLKEGRYIDVNERFLTVTGYRYEEVINRTVAELNIWGSFGGRAEIIKLLDENKRIRNLEINFHKKSGEIFVALLSAEVFESNGEQLLLCLANDITEFRQLQKKLLQLDRLNLVEQMAAGIAHEIRNPMTTIRGFLQLLQSKLEIDKYHDYFEIMLSELDKTNSIITDFLCLAKKNPFELQKQNLNTIIETLSPLINAYAMNSEMSISFELRELQDLYLNEKEICQLILNFVRNSIEAMSPGGTLVIRTYQEGNEIVLAIEDQGNGIAPNIIDKIGTPFLTTKNEGTGLGLATCYSIAGRHNAKIDVKSDSEGTIFFVRFQS